MDLISISQKAVHLVHQIGIWQWQQQQQFNKSKIEEKSQNHLVSYVDTESEQKLKEGLRNILPQAHFLAEESDNSNFTPDGLYWVIDPLDGTTNFMHGLPIYAISVALVEHKDILLGIIYCPGTCELFTAVKDDGAYYNGKPIHVTHTQQLSETLLATGFPYYKFNHLDIYMSSLAILMQNSRGLRRMGAAAIDLAYTAAGKFDAFFEYQLQPWDVAAGILLVQEAGGTVSTLTNDTNPLFAQSIIAGNQKIVLAVKSIFNTSSL